MKKITFILLSIFSFMAHAEMIAGFNIGAGTGSIELKNKNTGSSNEVDIDSSNISFYIGGKTESNNRVLVVYDSLSYEDGIGYELNARGIRLDGEFVYLDTMVKPY